MDRTLADALRRAAALTRAGRPVEATNAIRAALVRPAASPPGEGPAAGRGAPLQNPKILDLAAVRTEAGRTAGPTAPSGATTSGGSVGRTTARPIRPLADTVRLLAAARRAAGSPPARPVDPPPVPDGARFLSRKFDSVHGRREYRLYVPAAATDGPATGVVMMLHGCKQDPDDFASGTGMNPLADARGMVVVYPGQTTAANPSRCWNWFNAADQRRGGGEAAILAALAAAVAEEFAVAPEAVFVAGLSAGGAMAAVLADAYPDVFSAAGIHSGLPAGAASDVPSAFAAMAGRGQPAAAPPPRRHGARVIVFHGTADTVVHPTNGAAIVDRVVHRAAATDRHEGRTSSGRTYRRIVHRTGTGEPCAEHWILEGHGHAWSGGRPSGSYTDPDGPDASAEMLRFFSDTAGAGGDR